MSQTDQDTIQNLQAQAKDYQAEIGYLTLQKRAANKRIEVLVALLAAGEQRFADLQRATRPQPVPTTPTPAPAPAPTQAQDLLRGIPGQDPFVPAEPNRTPEP